MGRKSGRKTDSRGAAEAQDRRRRRNYITIASGRVDCIAGRVQERHKKMDI